jgi:hypothetical protein
MKAKTKQLSVRDVPGAIPGPGKPLSSASGGGAQEKERSRVH